MRAVVQDSYGSADVLRLARITRPGIADGEVLLRVHAAGLDRGTWHVMTGRPFLMRILGFGFRSPKKQAGQHMLVRRVGSAAMRCSWPRPSGRRLPGGVQHREARSGAVGGCRPCGRLYPGGFRRRRAPLRLDPGHRWESHPRLNQRSDSDRLSLLADGRVLCRGSGAGWSTARPAADRSLHQGLSVRGSLLLCRDKSSCLTVGFLRAWHGPRISPYEGATCGSKAIPSSSPVERPAWALAWLSASTMRATGHRRGSPQGTAAQDRCRARRHRVRGPGHPDPASIEAALIEAMELRWPRRPA